MLYVFVILMAVWGIFRGLDEGIDMHQPSNREHRWFAKYHVFVILRDTFGLCSGAFFILALPVTVFKAVTIIPGSLIWNWEMFEIFYSLTRYRRWIPDSENFLGLNLYLTDIGTVTAHWLRWITGAALIIVGLGI